LGISLSRQRRWQRGTACRLEWLNVRGRRQVCVAARCRRRSASEQLSDHRQPESSGSADRCVQVAKVAAPKPVEASVFYDLLPRKLQVRARFVRTLRASLFRPL
jgi:hypothetical protein